jgi:endonuclease-3 related protein
MVFPVNLQTVYEKLFNHFGPRGWWPGDSSFEHFAGCILAQNTRWDRVEPVIERMKSLGILAPSEFVLLDETSLGELLKGSGTYRRKAGYLMHAGRFMLSLGWDGSPGSVDTETAELRKALLSLKGIGPETCDCILLYVLERPVFVVDAYTKRILSRHGLCAGKDSYSAVQNLFHSSIERDLEVFKEYHALLVECAKQYCRPVPVCSGCPLFEGERGE